MQRLFFGNSSHWLRRAERARLSAGKLRGYPDLQAIMMRIAAMYEDLASKADQEEYSAD